MDPSLEILAARYRDFMGRPFPIDSAIVVNGIGLASLATRAERCVNEVVSNHMPRPTVDELVRLLAMCERALPAIPPGPRGYFDELRSILAESVQLAERHRPWLFDDRRTLR